MNEASSSGAEISSRPSGLAMAVLGWSLFVSGVGLYGGSLVMEWAEPDRVMMIQTATDAGLAGRLLMNQRKLMEIDGHEVWHALAAIAVLVVMLIVTAAVRRPRPWVAPTVCVLALISGPLSFGFQLDDARFLRSTKWYRVPMEFQPGFWVAAAGCVLAIVGTLLLAFFARGSSAVAAGSSQLDQEIIRLEKLERIRELRKRSEAGD